MSVPGITRYVSTAYQRLRQYHTEDSKRDRLWCYQTWHSGPVGDRPPEAVYVKGAKHCKRECAPGAAPYTYLSTARRIARVQLTAPYAYLSTANVCFKPKMFAISVPHIA
eukprot:3940748-Rhodomonas_salina.2